MIKCATCGHDKFLYLTGCHSDLYMDNAKDKQDSIVHTEAARSGTRTYIKSVKLEEMIQTIKVFLTCRDCMKEQVLVLKDDENKNNVDIYMEKA